MLHGDASWAHDVTQAVFMLLIQKSPRIGSDAALSVWLHRATRYASANAHRMRVRQYHRDRKAARPESDPSEAIALADDRDEQSRLLPVLDEAIAQLGPRDRAGVILCYFHRHTYRPDWRDAGHLERPPASASRDRSIVCAITSQRTASATPPRA
jgi:DNA-directed RNA polymerase specialized sigma24 family protein